MATSGKLRSIHSTIGLDQIVPSDSAFEAGKTGPGVANSWDAELIGDVPPLNTEPSAGVDRYEVKLE